MNFFHTYVTQTTIAGELLRAIDDDKIRAELDQLKKQLRKLAEEESKKRNLDQMLDGLQCKEDIWKDEDDDFVEIRKRNKLE